MKKSIAFAAVALIVVAVRAQSSDFEDQLIQGGKEISAARSQAASGAAPAGAAQQASGLRQLLQEEGVAIKPGETGYDALSALFEKGQAPSQADVTGSFSGQVFLREDPDQGTAYGFTGQEVAGSVSSQFEFVFKQQKLERGDPGDMRLGGDMPDYGNTFGPAKTEFGDHEATVQWRSDLYVGQIVKVDLKVRKVGRSVVALAQVEHLLHSDKPLWVGYFSRR